MTKQGPAGVLRGRVAALAVALSLAMLLPIAAQVQDSADLDAIFLIKEEGFQRSQVMEVASYLTDVHGPRLTNSPNMRAAADYAVDTLKSWGLSNVRLETWGPFGRGWSNERTVVHAVSPQAFPILAHPRAWTPGTGGPVTAEAIVAVIEDEADFEAHRGTLEGKIVLTVTPPDVEALWTAPARRFTEEDLTSLTRQPDPSVRPPTPGTPAARQDFLRKRMQLFLDEGVVALMEPGRGRGDHGSLLVTGGGPRNPDDPPVAPQIVVATEHYGRIARMLDKGLAVRIDLDIRNHFHDETLDSFNIIAEIPGTDKADELVMLGAHFDSWHTGTGATDNAAGTAAMMEAMRILQASGLQMRRTVRLALWNGEEQGLLGSRAYVREHFADRDTMALKPAHERFSGYFNIDNGTGAIRGVYLQGNEAVAPVFEAWMRPFTNLGMTTLAIRNTGGTDHLAFDAVGLPGFQFIQDPVEYSTRSHHTNLDLYERLQPRDMMINAVIAAAFAYHTANREERLPRKPLPAPPPSPPATSAQGAGR